MGQYFINVEPRFGIFSFHRTHATLLFKNLNFLNVFQINNFEISIFVYKCLIQLIPCYFIIFFTVTYKFHSDNTRDNNKLHIQYFRTSIYKFNVRYRAAIILNYQ